MRSDRTASANGHPVSPSHSSGPRTNLERLQAECRHQTVVISPAGAASRLADGELVELMIALDTGAPGAAREFVVACLEQRVVASALDSAQLLVSELVTNSLRHSGAPMDDVIVSVEVMPDWLRIVSCCGSESRPATRWPSPTLVRRSFLPGGAGCAAERARATDLPSSESRPTASPAAWSDGPSQHTERGATLPSGAVQSRSWMGPGRAESKTGPEALRPQLEAGSDRPGRDRGTTA